MRSIAYTVLVRTLLFLACLVCYSAGVAQAQTSYYLEQIPRPAYKSAALPARPKPIHCPYRYASIASLKACLSQAQTVPTGGTLQPYIKSLYPDLTDYPVFQFAASLPLSRTSGVEFTDSNIPTCDTSSSTAGSCVIGYTSAKVAIGSSDNSSLFFCRYVGGTIPADYFGAGRTFTSFGLSRYTAPPASSLYYTTQSTKNTGAIRRSETEFPYLPDLGFYGFNSNVLTDFLLQSENIQAPYFTVPTAPKTYNFIYSACSPTSLPAAPTIVYHIVSSTEAPTEPSAECIGKDGKPYLAVIPNVSPFSALSLAESLIGGAIETKDETGSPILLSNGSSQRCKVEAEDIHFVAATMTDYIVEDDISGLVTQSDRWISLSQARTNALVGFVDANRPDAVRIDVVISGPATLPVLDPTVPIPRGSALVVAGPLVDLSHEVRNRGWRWAIGVKTARIRSMLSVKRNWLTAAAAVAATITVDVLSQGGEIELVEEGITDPREPDFIVPEGTSPLLTDQIVTTPLPPVVADDGVTAEPTQGETPAPTVEQPQEPFADLTDAKVSDAIDKTIDDLGGSKAVADAIDKGAIDVSDIVDEVALNTDWNKLPAPGQKSETGIVDAVQGGTFTETIIREKITERIIERVQDPAPEDLPDADMCTFPELRAQNSIDGLVAKIGGPATSLIAPLLGLSAGDAQPCFTVLTKQQAAAVYITLSEDLRICISQALISLLVWAGWLSTAFMGLRIIFR